MSQDAPTRQAAVADNPKYASVLAALALLLAATLSLVWSHARLMWNDELYSFYSDSVATFGDVLRVQRLYPLNIDPPSYHLLSHAAMDLFGRNAIALRLPALFGFLLLQVCAYVFVRRIAGARAAVIACIFPLLTDTFFLSVEGRPYGLLLGLYALSLVCWQSATRSTVEGSGLQRLPALFGLWLALTLAITTHYFGVLVLLPVCAAELSRIVMLRRVDKGMLATLLLGIASLGLLLPFLGATKAYRNNYYTVPVGPHVPVELYRSVFHDRQWPAIPHFVELACIVLLFLWLFRTAVRRLRSSAHAEPVYEWVALLTLSLLPIFTYLVARFVTHTIQSRYATSTIFAFAAATGIALQRQLRRNMTFYGLVALMLTYTVTLSVHNILEERRNSATLLERFKVTAADRAMLANAPAGPIFMQPIAEFLVDSYYEPDPALRARLSLFGGKEELHWLNSNTGVVTANNMSKFVPFRVANYDSVLQSEKPLVVVFDGDPESWVSRDLATRGIAEKPLGQLWGGTLVQLQTPAKPVTP